MCEWCESQYDGEVYHFQEKGPGKMLIYNGDILGVELEDGTIISWTTINYCPNCGRDLLE